MKLYLLTQDVVGGYDTYDSALVAALSENDARDIHPSAYVTHVTDGKWMGTYSRRAIGEKGGQEYENEMSSWPVYRQRDFIKAEYLGETEKPRGVILASFNAG